MSLLIATLVAAHLAVMPEPPIEPNADACFISTLCAIKESVRWRTPKWDETMCNRVGNAILKAEKKHKLPRQLIVSVILNESDMNEQAMRPTLKDDKVVAWDVGLMAPRCRLGKDGKCDNYKSKGLTVGQLMKPEINIEVGTSILANVRDTYACPHKNHPWWAHYNWGPKVLDTGAARGYPHRVAVLYKAMATATNTKAPELIGLKLPKEKGRKQRSVDEPVGKRHKELVAKVLACGGKCQQVAIRDFTLAAGN